ncbi:hypothetical protein [Stieleria varia]|uniref:Lipase (Class 3) n=1 Tax=Stieleria varia TaxID=2528005 RepID=A0A5C6B9F6_9BACT|nr:hypothetical protein [Stieleria varia]TWU08357.1 hypothetical protein Pla52n_09390 [Stieleria varia]
MQSPWVAAYAGTNDFPDLITDIFQGVFGGGTDYKHAIADGEKIVNQFGANNVRFVGHSLGGGLAVAAAAVHNTKATTYNAAGVNRLTLAPYNATLAGIDQRVNAFRVQDEFLSTFQDSGSIVGYVMPDSNGTSYYLPGEGNTFIRHTSDVLFDGLNQI